MYKFLSFWNLEIILDAPWPLSAPFYETFLSVIMLIEDDFIGRTITIDCSRNNKMNSRALNSHSADANAVQRTNWSASSFPTHNAHTIDSIGQSPNKDVENTMGPMHSMHTKFVFGLRLAAWPLPHRSHIWIQKQHKGDLHFRENRTRMPNAIAFIDSRLVFFSLSIFCRFCCTNAGPKGE